MTTRGFTTLLDDQSVEVVYMKKDSDDYPDFEVLLDGKVIKLDEYQYRYILEEIEKDFQEEMIAYHEYMTLDRPYDEWRDR